jgi:NTE family protein
MNNIVDRCFHLAMKGSVQSKIDSCTLYIEPPNMSQFSLFNLKKSDEIYDYGYQYALTFEKQIKELDLDM